VLLPPCARRLFHSTTSMVCPAQFSSMPRRGAAAAGAAQDGGGAPVLSVSILQDKMNKTVSFDPERFTMTVQSGMKLREFTAEATRVGMSVQVGTLPAYAGLTLGGVLSTSAHGSGDQATSSLCDTLISVTWVNALGEVTTSPRDSQEVRLLCGGLGLIGVVTEMKIQMTPPSHTKLITRYLSKDDNLVEEVEKMLKV
jgi:FAD/FMN-containing dehydrogenase